MSRPELANVANLGRRLTPEEEQYLRDRSMAHDIAVNHRMYPNEAETLLPESPEVNLFGSADDDDNPHQDAIDFSKFEEQLVKEVQALPENELKQELTDRKVVYSADDSMEKLQEALLKAVTSS